MRRIRTTLLIVGLLVACREPSPEELAARIASSEELQYIDQICGEFPKPSNFRQVKKGVSGNAEKTIIYYQYLSDLSFAAVQDFYKDSNQRGYVLESEDFREPEDFMSLLRFRRKDIRIVLEHRPPSAIFNIDCIR